MKDVIVFSPVENTSKDIATSAIWKNAWHKEEIDVQAMNKWSTWWKYTIKFDGLLPIQLTKTQKLHSSNLK